MFTKIEKLTKQIYTSQHLNFSIGKDKSIFNRFLNHVKQPSYYGLTKNFFKGKSVLDVGCGNTGFIEVAMYLLGVSNIACVDIGKSWIPHLKKVLATSNVPETLLTYTQGSTTKIPFANSSFDFVISHGVLMHLENINKAKIALKELVRVTKKGGYIYLYTGVDKPGIVDKYILPSLRKAYKEDKNFRYFIDKIDYRKITKNLIECFHSAKRYDKSFNKDFLNLISGLFTIDSETFVKNAVQVPVQQGPLLDFGFIKQELNKLGIKNVKRIPEIYWKRNDFRRYLAPFHYRLDVPLSKMFWGGGHVKIICYKHK